MKNKNVSYDTADIRSEAFSWIAQLETGELSPEDLTAFEEWISRSPRHYSEIRELAEFSMEVNQLAQLSDAIASEQINQNASIRKGKMGIPTYGKTIFAAISAVCFFAFVWVSQSNEKSDIYNLTTPIGTVQEVALSDGSRVKLNTNSEIEVDFNSGERKIRLVRGEAFFDVAHNPDKPFAVYVEDRRVTAVGTAFAVHKSSSGLTVTVTEGKVALEENGYDQVPLKKFAKENLDDGKTTGKIISAGQKVEYLGRIVAPVVEELKPKDITRELSWRAGFLEFDKMPLHEVIEEMQRYTTIKVKLEDHELGEMRFGGFFKAGETEAFFEALEYSFDIDVVRSENEALIKRLDKKKVID